MRITKSHNCISLKRIINSIKNKKKRQFTIILIVNLIFLIQYVDNYYNINATPCNCNPNFSKINNSASIKVIYSPNKGISKFKNRDNKNNENISFNLIQQKYLIGQHSSYPAPMGSIEENISETIECWGENKYGLLFPYANQMDLIYPSLLYDLSGKDVPIVLIDYGFDFNHSIYANLDISHIRYYNLIDGLLIQKPISFTSLSPSAYIHGSKVLSYLIGDLHTADIPESDISINESNSSIPESVNNNEFCWGGFAKDANLFIIDLKDSSIDVNFSSKEPEQYFNQINKQKDEHKQFQDIIPKSNLKYLPNINLDYLVGAIEQIPSIIDTTKPSLVSLSMGIMEKLQNSDRVSSVINQITKNGSNWPLFISAAGNIGSAGEMSVYTPASDVSVIGVGAYNFESLMVSDFSGQGPSINGHIEPDVVAPGENIWTPFYSQDYAIGLENINNFTKISGTSFSTPMITALIANFIQYCSEYSIYLTPSLIRKVIGINSIPLYSDDSGLKSMNQSNQYGWGIPQLGSMIFYISYLKNIEKSNIIQISFENYAQNSIKLSNYLQPDLYLSSFEEIYEKINNTNMIEYNCLSEYKNGYNILIPYRSFSLLLNVSTNYPIFGHISSPKFPFLKFGFTKLEIKNISNSFSYPSNFDSIFSISKDKNVDSHVFQGYNIIADENSRVPFDSGYYIITIKTTISNPLSLEDIILIITFDNYHELYWIVISSFYSLIILIWYIIIKKINNQVIFLKI